MYAYAPSNWLNLRFYTHLCDLLRLTHVLSLPYAICEPLPFLRLVISLRESQNILEYSRLKCDCDAVESKSIQGADNT